MQCIEITVNYIAIHCNTLYYTVEYTAAHRPSGNKTGSNNVDRT